MHMGVMGGTLNLVQRAYLGVDVRDGVMYFDPKVIDELDGLSLPMQFCGTPIRVTLEGGELTAAALAVGFSPPIHVGVGEEVRELAPGERCVFTVAGAAAARARGSRPGK